MFSRSQPDIYPINPLTKEQLEAQVEWLNTWEQLRDTAIPLRFYEKFSKNLELSVDNKPIESFWKRIWTKLMIKKARI